MLTVFMHCARGEHGVGIGEESMRIQVSGLPYFA